MTYTYTHEDLTIISEEPVNFRQFYDETLNYSNLSFNQETYADYRPTKLQFHLSSINVNQTIQLHIPYANRLTRLQAKKSIVCRYDQNLKTWVVISHQLDEKNKKLIIETSRIGIFCVFVNHYWYTSYTQRLADEYPNWTKIRNDKESVGQQFLNYFGMELEQIEDYLDWISEQKYIQTADIHVHDWIYMYQLPEIHMSDFLQVYKKRGNQTEEIPVLETIQSFFYNDANQGGIFDYEDNRFYTAKKYGKLQLKITRPTSVTTHIIEPVDFHVWNAFDEFGLLLGVKRLHLEDNANFKERILDVFRYPSGTHDIGLTNGIARDLNLIKHVTWIDDSKHFVLKSGSGNLIDKRTIRLDNQPLTEEELKVDEVGNVIIFAKNQGKSHDVSFITSIQKYQLYDKDHRGLYSLMYREDGQATSLMLKWVEYINTFAPVMWDRFNWDEGFWDTISKDLTGLGYVPNFWDSNIDHWKNYVFESDR